jgi:hypothetical protein
LDCEEKTGVNPIGLLKRGVVSQILWLFNQIWRLIMKITNAIRPAMAAIVLSAAFAVATPARAAGPTGTYGSGITCTNLDTSLPATLVLTFYPADSDQAVLTYTDPTQVAPGASRLYFTPNTPPGLTSGFLGSAVVSSDRALACNVNTQVVGAGVGTLASPARIGTSAGLDSSQASAVIYAPQVIRAAGGFNSYLAVQNTDSASVDVTVSYLSRTGVDPAANETVTIKPQATHVFYQSDNTKLPAGFIGGAKVSSIGGKLVGVVAIYNDGASAETAQFLSYNTMTTGGPTLIIPRYVRNYYGNESGLTVQNIGTAPVSLKITFTFQGVNYTVNTAPVAPGAVYVNYAKDVAELLPVDALGMTKRFGSAKVEAPGGSIIAIVNEDNRGSCYGADCPSIPAEFKGWGSAYNAFVDGTATNTIFFPQVPSKASTSLFSGGVQLVNTSAAAGTCTITYAGVPAATQSNVAVAANNSLSIFVPDVPGMVAGFNGAVKAACTMPVFGISNLSARLSTYRGDTLTTANGLNQ